MDNMEEDEIITAVCTIFICAGLHIFRQQRQGKRIWVRPWIQRREEKGAYNALLKEISLEDPISLRNFIRMDMTSFNQLLEMVDPYIRKKDTFMRNSIPPAERLALTLRFLATGDSYSSLQYLYRIPKNTTASIIPETCDAVYNALKDTFLKEYEPVDAGTLNTFCEPGLKVPDTKAAWLSIAKDFEEKWDFPNCIGAMDGKHVAVKCPPKSGSTYFNYKNYFSIILFAIVDADYNFLYVDVGTNGRADDSGIFGRSSIKSLLENSENLPDPRPLPGRHVNMPYVIVGDDAFPLKDYLLKPFPNRHMDIEKRVFNYRLSRARRVVENVFGILASRFGFLQRALPLEPDKVTKCVLAACALHNFFRSKSSQVYTPEGSFDNQISSGEWRNESNNFVNMAQQGGNRNTTDARSIRDEFKDYFNTNGQVYWQWDLL